MRVRIEKLTRPDPRAFGAGRAYAERYEALLRTREREILREERRRERRLLGV